MTTFTALTDSQLQADKPVIESLVRAGFRDNLQATVEGDASVPVSSQIQPRSMNSCYFLATRTTDYLPNLSTFPSGTAFKMPFSTEVYDPSTCYDNATNYRFTPNRAGLYLVTVHVRASTTTPNSTINVLLNVTAQIRKNGSVHLVSQSGPSAAIDGSGTNTSINTSATVTALVQMNGSTDYLEGFGVGTWNSATQLGYQGYFHAVGLCQT